MTQIDARLHPRHTPVLPIRLSFTLGGHRLAGAELASMGAGGLGAWLDEGHAALFEPGYRLREIAFDHPAAPVSVPDMRLVFSTLKGQSAVPGRMMFGAQFIEPSPGFLQALETFLASEAFRDAGDGFVM